MVLTVSDSISSGGSNASQPNQSSAVTQPLSFSRKVKVLAFILGCCCMVAIIVNFINLHSDYEELQEFYLGFMGRKMLIQEKRLTSKTYLKLLRRAQLESIEVSLSLFIHKKVKTLYQIEDQRQTFSFGEQSSSWIVS